MALTATVFHVDLTRGTVETKTLPEDVYRKYPGGSALAAYLLLRAMPAGADPLGPGREPAHWPRYLWPEPHDRVRAIAAHRCDR